MKKNQSKIIWAKKIFSLSTSLILFILILTSGTSCVEDFIEENVVELENEFLTQQNLNYSLQMLNLHNNEKLRLWDGSNDGVEGFYFLPPLVNKIDFSGEFDPAQEPVVEISDDLSFKTVLRTFTVSSEGISQVRVNQEEGFYMANWQISDGGQSGKLYRLRVRIADRVYGHIDVGVVQDRSQKVEGAQINLNQNETLPIRFRVEKGVEFTIPIVSRSISTFNSHSCGLTIDGKAYCWGWNWAGQIGDGSYLASSGGINIPVEVLMPEDVRFVKIDVGGNHVLALSSTGTVYSWGSDRSGQLGLGNENENCSTGPCSIIPRKVKIPGDEKIVSVSGGMAHSLALTLNGEIYQWGIGFNNIPQKLQFQEVFKSISAGGNFNSSTSYAISISGELYSWGDNRLGQLGIGTTTSQAQPTLVLFPNNEKIIKIGGGQYHAISLTEGGNVYTWGLNSNGQLGDGTNVLKTAPIKVQLPTNLQIIEVFAGIYSSSAISQSGESFLWGYRQAILPDSWVPSLLGVPEGVKYVKVVMGDQHAIAMSDKGIGYSWGGNSVGQLGIGSSSFRVAEPTKLAGDIIFY